MDQKHEIIKGTVEYFYEVIKNSEEALKELRGKCDHPEIEEMDYMWAPGHLMRGKICKICGEVTQTMYDDDHNIIVTTSK